MFTFEAQTHCDAISLQMSLQQQQRMRSKSTDALHRQPSQTARNSNSPNCRMDSGTLKKMLKPVREWVFGCGCANHSHFLELLVRGPSPESEFRVLSQKVKC